METSEDFIRSLYEGNVIVEDNDSYIMIENRTYHTEEHPQYVVFLKGQYNTEVTQLFKRFDGWFIWQNSTELRSVLNVPHWHMVRDFGHWYLNYGCDAYLKLRTKS